DLQRAIRTALASAAAKLHSLEDVYSLRYDTLVTVFSPDGKTLLAGGKDVYLFDVTSKRSRLILKDAPSNVSWGAFSPDGRRFAICTNGSVIHVAETATGLDIGAPLEHKGTVKTVAFSPDGKSLLVAARFGVPLQCYDVETGQPRLSFD